MSYVLGLDSGGTKTLIALAEETGAVLAVGSGASLDPTASDEWKAALARQVGEATQGRKAPLAAAFGLSFHDEIEDFTHQQKQAAATLLPTSKVVVQNDVRIAFDGAFATGGGVLVLAGTGSMAWASRNGPGDRHYRIGGYGDAFGDEGSACWIGRESLSIASQALDGRLTDAGEFAQGILDGLSITSDRLIDWVYSLSNQRTAIAGVAKITAALAASGSLTAQGLLDRACDHLAAHVLAAERLVSTPGSVRQPWSYAGGVFANPVILDGVRRRIGSDPRDPVLPPIGGAVLRAAQLAGWKTDAAFIGQLKRSLQQILQSTTQ
ncbi:N-acetylglucosamine kinase [Rhizobium mayense]|uniref:BadF/BadG/BcrA/BcrD ATPase family protein n=1 Tax=Rhizobium mayense TaxID=1312184 RepID=A0ABT7JPJ7_9HYPH|nr:BadF/BadG/BcrA/BcrD ATPase family protein [Rhizobium mayense]MDL2398186.1 BadF/BadG/BcrA/BcrD ATPase family protein [Rhizobium mayense]